MHSLNICMSTLLTSLYSCFSLSCSIPYNMRWEACRITSQLHAKVQQILTVQPMSARSYCLHDCIAASLPPAGLHACTTSRSANPHSCHHCQMLLVILQAPCRHSFNVSRFASHHCESAACHPAGPLHAESQIPPISVAHIMLQPFLTIKQVPKNATTWSAHGTCCCPWRRFSNRVPSDLTP